MTDFEIVEYEPSHAAGLADMWSRSGDSWGGYSVEFTAESIRSDMERSVHVGCFLAVAGEEVVGFCKVGKWAEEEGALYVDTLNVRPDFHGKKIGKALMLKAVERTIELGWPRLDLYTWPGNTKAVPLYKKTGFFWEEREGDVYLVNFIPEILGNELVKDRFETIDWYGDSTRTIEICPDGREENGFTYFTYSWKAGGQELSLEYARRGRGLRRIDCDAFTITATVEDLNLVIGRSSGVRYDIVNKTSRPLDVGVRGRDDKNIAFDLSYRGAVEHEVSVEGRFFVGEIDAAQSKWKTHPRVSAVVSIDGRSASFDVGIVPKFPADIRFRRADGPLLPGVDRTAYLDVESNLDEPAELRVALPKVGGLRFAPGEVSCTLDPRQRVSVPLPYVQDRCCVLSGSASASMTPRDGERIEFGRRVGCAFPLHAGTYHGEIEEGEHDRSSLIGNGPHQVTLKLRRDSGINTVGISNVMTAQGGLRLFAPQLGKPYTEEFARLKPVDLQVSEGSGSIMLRAEYRPAGFPDTQISTCIRLYSSGLAQRWFEVRNTGSSAFDTELWIREDFWMDLVDTVIPYDGGILETRRGTQNLAWYWTHERVTENWVFSRGERGTVAAIWDAESVLRLGEWAFGLEHRIPALAPGGMAATHPVSVALDLFTSWQQCREYALGHKVDRHPASAESLEPRINGGNPFVPAAFDVEVTEHKQQSLKGAIRVSSGSGAFPEVRRNCDSGNAVKELSFPVDAGEMGDSEILFLDVELDTLRYRRGGVVFPIRGSGVQVSTSVEQGLEVCAADNGVLRIKSSAAYAPGLFSCTLRGEEWLDSTFPVLGPRDWWNPWIGGLCTHPSSMEGGPLLKESTQCEAVERMDEWGNTWAGIAVRTVFAEHEDYRGMECSQYFLLLPGVPVLLNQVEIRQNTGRFFGGEAFTAELFVQGSRDISRSQLRFRNHLMQPVGIPSGREDLSVGVRGDISLVSPERGERLTFVCDPVRTRVTGGTQKATTALEARDRVRCEHGATAFLPAKFLVFSALEMEEDWLRDLRGTNLRSTRKWTQ